MGDDATEVPVVMSSSIAGEKGLPVDVDGLTPDRAEAHARTLFGRPLEDLRKSEKAHAARAVLEEIDEFELRYDFREENFVVLDARGVWLDVGEDLVRVLNENLLGDHASKFTFGELRSLLKTDEIDVETIEQSRTKAALEGYPLKNGEPIIEVEIEGIQAVTDPCPFCGDRHRHGAVDPHLLDGGLSHRVAHCVSTYRGGYYLKLKPNEEPSDDLLLRAENASRRPIARAGGET